LARLQRLLRELTLIRQAFRNWPTVAIAGLLWRHLPLPRRDLTIVTHAGTRFVVPLGPKAGALYPALEVFAFSEYAYEWELEGEPQVVDVGAHIGAFALWAAEQYPGLRIVCFEPDPEAFRYLVQNVHGISARVRECALGASRRTAPLARPLPGGAISTLKTAAANDAVDVEVVPFEEVIDELSDVALLKLDCEGSEYELVLETSPSAWARVRRIVMEYHAVPGHEPSELVERLEAHGFRLVRERSGAEVGTYWFSR
jgi:FkbM family methyltransferase